jgi:hypothetical protein
MSLRTTTELMGDEPGGGMPARPTRMRLAKKRSTRARKSSRQAASPPGIHRRANKRMSW